MKFHLLYTNDQYLSNTRCFYFSTLYRDHEQLTRINLIFFISSLSRGMVCYGYDRYLLLSNAISNKHNYDMALIYCGLFCILLQITSIDNLNQLVLH